jgi:hypothetical protein
LFTQHALSYICLRRFPEANRKLDQVLDITPDDVDTLALKAAIAQAQGDLAQASVLLASLQLPAEDVSVWERRAYQAILERRPGSIVSQLVQILDQPKYGLGYQNGELRFWLGWAQNLSGDRVAAETTWRKTRSELEVFIKEQPENYRLIGILALTDMGLGDKAAALRLAEQGMDVLPIENDAFAGPGPLEIFARVAAGTGDSDRATAALQKLLSMPYEGALALSLPLTPPLLRLDPMFDSVRDEPRFQKLVALPASKP